MHTFGGKIFQYEFLAGANRLLASSISHDSTDMPNLSKGQRIRKFSI